MVAVTHAVRRLTLTVGALVLAFAHLTSAAEPGVREVRVTGTAITRVAPDIVVWTITARHTDRDLMAAQNGCAASVRELLAMAEGLGVAKGDVQTGYLSIDKVFERDQAGNERAFRHYDVTRVVTIRQRDVDGFDAALAKLSADPNLRVSFQLEASNYTEVRAETRLDAVRAARTKAAAMCELLGAKLGRVIDIQEPRDASPWGGYNFVANSVRAGGAPAEPDQDTGTFSPGTIEVRVSIEVAFELE